MLKKMTSFIFLALSLNALAQGAPRLETVVASQQAKLEAQQAELQNLKSALDQLKNQTDKQEKSLKETNQVAVTARDRADAVGSKFFMNETGGNRSCQEACYANGSPYCVVAYGGIPPFATWTCAAKPQGNLICLCARN